MKVHLSLTAARADVASDLSTLGRRAIALARRRLAEAAPRIWEHQRALCPVAPEDGGQMRDSIRWQLTSGGASFARVTFSVGGDVLLPFVPGKSAAIYPLIQESDPTLRHSVGRAGFMQEPVAAQAPRVLAAIMADLDQELRRAAR